MNDEKAKLYADIYGGRTYKADSALSATLRAVSAKPNLQTLPIGSAEAAALRKAFAFGPEINLDDPIKSVEGPVWFGVDWGVEDRPHVVVIDSYAGLESAKRAKAADVMVSVTKGFQRGEVMPTLIKSRGGKSWMAQEMAAAILGEWRVNAEQGQRLIKAAILQAYPRPSQNA